MVVKWHAQEAQNDGAGKKARVAAAPFIEWLEKAEEEEEETEEIDEAQPHAKAPKEAAQALVAAEAGAPESTDKEGSPPHAS